MRVTAALTLAVALLLAAAGPSAAAAPVLERVEYPGMQKLRFKFGPVKITPGQNTIELKLNDFKPSVPGYITRFKPDLVRTRGGVPPVDQLHLHHGVWLMRGYPAFAAGEEKTITQLPQGFGYRYAPSDQWFMNYMIHNLLPNEDSVYITYEIDFVPATAAAAQGLTEAHPLWMDVAGLQAYPVFDVKRGWGRGGRYTFPDQARGAERAKIGPMQRVTVPEDMTLIGTAGHLHPGGLWTDLAARRGGREEPVFRSEAKYFEPAGAVSWDVAMTVTDPGWRVALRAGDELDVSATYDSGRASWYESMGIMNVWFAKGDVGGADPFAEPVDTRGVPSHGHLPENDNHGGGFGGLPDARSLLGGPPPPDTIGIRDFVYARGDLSLTGSRGRPPVVRRGRSLRFANRDDAQEIQHTITACKAPCTGRTGVAYPLADGRGNFDSGTLGFGPPGFTAAAQRTTWKTPKGLGKGTYTYFCRIHPFMRGAFRVKGEKRTARRR